MKHGHCAWHGIPPKRPRVAPAPAAGVSRRVTGQVSWDRGVFLVWGLQRLPKDSTHMQSLTREAGWVLTCVPVASLCQSAAVGPGELLCPSASLRCQTENRTPAAGEGGLPVPGSQVSSSWFPECTGPAPSSDAAGPHLCSGGLVHEVHPPPPLVTHAETGSGRLTYVLEATRLE